MAMPQLRRCVVHWLGRALAIVLASSSASAASGPQRVASLNLCTDQLLLALADPVQILSLSPLARDASLSYLSGKAGAFPVNQGRGEAILFSGADLVLVGPFEAHAKRELMEREGLSVMVLDPWQSVDEGRDQIRRLARRLGHPDRGEALIRTIDEALTRGRNSVHDAPSILTYYRGGWVPSSASLVNEILRVLGFSLHQEALGLAQGGVARLESIVASPPDYLLMDEATGESMDNGSALLVHPALAAAVPAGRRLMLASRLSICGGPATPALIESLVAEARAKVRNGSAAARR
jgi:iron complex transport system substrate-binding protein